MRTVIIRGSWGHLTVDQSTGVIIEYDPEYTMSPDEPGYSDIAYVLPSSLVPGHDWCLDKHGETDILCVSYVTTGGRLERRMTQVPDQRYPDELIYQDLPALPAPRWRTIEDSDVASATRGLSMRRLTDGELATLKARHMLVDLFASAVIVMAVTAEQRKRQVT